MATPITIKQRAAKFQLAESPEDMATLLRTSSARMVLYAAHPRYHIYTIKKGNGKSRLIEDPVIPMKLMLRHLNDHLQACYHKIRPEMVYGFCITAGREEERNIVTNARMHLGKDWLLNIDFKDFFHTVLFDRVQTIWQTHFKKMNRRLVETLTKLTCFNNRLPMGSPASPALSNYAAWEMDHELSQLCQNMGITCTRFADDCSFSCGQEIDSKTVGLIRDVITSHRFMINEEKVALFKPGDEKTVTGIIVGEKELSLPASYLQQLQTEISRLQQTLAVERRFQTGMSFKKLDLFERELRGKINYAQMVLGETPETENLYTRFENALDTTEAFESDNWLEIPYNFF
jgi:RNA-directed DNA polymerase